MSISLLISWIRIISASIGIFFAFYFLSSDIELSIHIVNLACVIIIGLISFISHNIFYKSEAERLKFGDSGKEYQFEVGFANLAIALAGLIAYLLELGTGSESIIILCYALYFLQAGILHLVSFVKDNTNKRKLFSTVVALLISFMMIYFAVKGLFY